MNKTIGIRLLNPALCLIFALLLITPPRAGAAEVTGSLTGYEGQHPGGGRYLHLENAATHDIYMAPVGPDGSFAVELPPGVYRLRAERGAMLKRWIIVDRTAVALGAVHDLAPFDPLRLFERQTIAPALIVSATPSTANIMTRDEIRLPPPSIAPAPAAAARME